MKRVLADLHAAWQFMQTGLRQIDKNASLFPSSRFLVEAMVSAAPLAQAQCVIEFGPGTGAVTKAILQRLPPDAHLHAVELNGELLETTTRLMSDPRLRSHHGSAAEAAKLVRESGCTMGADAVFSSLGLALMSDDLRAAILRDACDLLVPEGTFVQYSYPHAKALTYQFDQGWSRFDGHSFLKGHFRDVHSKFIWLNAPPAVVHACRGQMFDALPTPLPRHRSRKTARRHLRVVGGKR